MTAPFRNVSFDDRDTDRFRYSNNWFLQGTYNATRVGESGTLASARDETANVTFTFPTPALGFAYYGIPRCCGGNYAICIDCTPEAPVWIPIDGVVPTDDGQNPPVALYTQFFDKPGVHEIILTNLPDPRFGKSQITLDRFELFVPDDSPKTSTTPASSTPRSSADAAGAVSGPQSNNNVAIIAGVAGGVVALILLLLAFLLVYRKKQQRRRAALMMETPPMEYSYAPRVDPSPSTYGSSQYAPSMRSTSLTNYSGGRTYHTTNPSITSNPFSSRAPSISTSRRAPIRETDAGLLVEADGARESTLPPEYGQVFGRRTTTVPLSSGVTDGDNSSSAGLTSSNSEVSSGDRKMRF